MYAELTARPVRRAPWRTAAIVAIIVAGFVALPSVASAADFGEGRVTGFAANPTGGWSLTYPNGRVDVGGGAAHHGDTGDLSLNLPVTGMASTPTGGGYWLVASDGGIFSFGDARFLGSTGDMVLNQPIVGMAATPSGDGYWMVATDGGIFSFGDAFFFGSTGAMALNEPIVGMASTASGNGYWLVASDGGIFSFGDARFFGSTGDLGVTSPVVGMLSSPTGKGYWLVGGDGQVYAFGDAEYHGAPAGEMLGAAIGIAGRANRSGYVVVDTGGHHVCGPDQPATCSHVPSDTGPVTLAIAEDVVVRTNAERVARGLAPLARSASLAEDATALADEMAARNEMAHLVDFSTLLPDHGATAAGENIAYTSSVDVASRAHEMWMLSDGHRTNMLNPAFDHIGVGVACIDGRAYLSMLLIRTSGSGSISYPTPPVEPIVRRDFDSLSTLNCL